MYEDEETGIEWEGFESFKDYSDFDASDLSHMIADGFITLARLRGTTIESQIRACLQAHLKIKESMNDYPGRS